MFNTQQIIAVLIVLAALTVLAVRSHTIDTRNTLDTQHNSQENTTLVTSGTNHIHTLRVGPDDELAEGRTGLNPGNNNQKKKKQGVHKKYKKFLSMLPMFLIPFVIQATLLPIFLASLKMIAIKSVFIGKLALFLVGYNALRNASIKKKQDTDNEHIAVEYYGYNGDMEYGAFVNKKRSL